MQGWSCSLCLALKSCILIPCIILFIYLIIAAYLFVNRKLIKTTFCLPQLICPELPHKGTNFNHECLVLTCRSELIDRVFALHLPADKDSGNVLCSTWFVCLSVCALTTMLLVLTTVCIWVERFCTLTNHLCASVVFDNPCVELYDLIVI